MKTRMYHLIVRNTHSGVITYLTRYPMQHEQCMVNKSKFNPATQSRIELLEVTE